MSTYRGGPWPPRGRGGRASTKSESGCLCNAKSLYNSKMCLSNEQDLTYMSFSWICLVQDQNQLKDCTCSDTRTKGVYRAYWLDQHKETAEGLLICKNATSQYGCMYHLLLTDRSM
ncbi:MAG: hypothetical protein FRX49_06813 [Trebouxia sp. A1-2]|nr:MAG: hypothetical protein FRX49_06813 [Trebouxia sp. A1-2]